MNLQKQDTVRPGRVMINEVPRWRILLASPFMKIALLILGAQNVTLEEPPLEGIATGKSQDATGSSGRQAVTPNPSG